MTTDIKELVKRLRAWSRDVIGADETFAAAADAIEALAGEVDALKRDIARHMTIANEAAAERDRLKAALETIAHDNVPREVFIVWRTDGSNSRHDKCQHMRVMYEDCGNCTALFARKALGGDE